MRNTIFDTRTGTASLGGNGNYDFLPTLTDAAIAADAPLAIAEMADLFGVTHRTLHFYEEKGLISPHRLGAMRVYGADCIRRMSIISACREMGLSLASIQELMLQIAEAQTQQEADLLFKTALETRKRELASELSTLHRQLQQIRTFTDGVSNSLPCKHESLPALTDGERDCLLLLTEGYKGGRLAEKLGISSSELTDLEEQLISKLGVANRYQAAAKALILGILPH
ncbi:MerR family transcriptional regulator [Rhizobium sp. FKY42]|uniref:MerR family transcriptional regulator n=1 Tax=Rhizobium sp. FKY42 TaxID=2562310 RepID=UPI0010C0C395|nr:MerR family transcriptional regulator [Rhizobium sp. FKY42]